MCLQGNQRASQLGKVLYLRETLKALLYSVATQVCVHRYNPSAAIFLSNATESELQRQQQVMMY